MNLPTTSQNGPTISSFISPDQRTDERNGVYMHSCRVEDSSIKVYSKREIRNVFTSHGIVRCATCPDDPRLGKLHDICARMSDTEFRFLIDKEKINIILLPGWEVKEIRRPKPGYAMYRVGWSGETMVKYLLRIPVIPGQIIQVKEAVFTDDDDDDEDEPIVVTPSTVNRDMYTDVIPSSSTDTLSSPSTSLDYYMKLGREFAKNSIERNTSDYSNLSNAVAFANSRGGHLSIISIFNAVKRTIKKTHLPFNFTLPSQVYINYGFMAMGFAHYADLNPSVDLLARVYGYAKNEAKFFMGIYSYVNPILEERRAELATSSSTPSTPVPTVIMNPTLTITAETIPVSTYSARLNRGSRELTTFFKARGWTLFMADTRIPRITKVTCYRHTNKKSMAKNSLMCSICKSWMDIDLNNDIRRVYRYAIKGHMINANELVTKIKLPKFLNAFNNFPEILKVIIWPTRWIYSQDLIGVKAKFITPLVPNVQEISDAAEWWATQVLFPQNDNYIQRTIIRTWPVIAGAESSARIVTDYDTEVTNLRQRMPRDLNEHNNAIPPLVVTPSSISATSIAAPSEFSDATPSNIPWKRELEQHPQNNGQPPIVHLNPFGFSGFDNL